MPIPRKRFRLREHHLGKEYPEVGILTEINGTKDFIDRGEKLEMMELAVKRQESPPSQEERLTPCQLLPRRRGCNGVQILFHSR